METSDDETKRYLVHFLKDFKNLIYQDRLWIKDRQSTYQALIALGYTLKNLEPILLSIKVEDYCAGPKPDEYIPGEHYWEFGKLIENQEFYIKVKITQQRNGEKAVCLSFHPAEWPLSFPFKQEG